MGENRFDIAEWEYHCVKAANALESVKTMPHDIILDTAIEVAMDMLGLAHSLGGVACERCGGRGSRTYGSTATWHGGIGGQQLTPGVCDKCWGTGRKDHTGINLKRLMAERDKP